MKFGSWKINVTSGMPQKVATAFGKLSEQLLGAEYQPIAYLGSQEVNGINHAVLAEQTVLAGKDTKNVVLIIFNEKGMECELVNIERVLESGGALGGTQVEAQTTIPEEAQKAWDKAFEGFVGSNVTPFAYLGSQLTNVMNYFFAATARPIVADPEDKAVIVMVNPMEVDFTSLLENKNTLGYSFSWRIPLGEWP